MNTQEKDMPLPSPRIVEWLGDPDPTVICPIKKTVCQVKCHAPERLEPIASAT
jgi:hypothetical protein